MPFTIYYSTMSPSTSSTSTPCSLRSLIPFLRFSSVPSSSRTISPTVSVTLARLILGITLYFLAIVKITGSFIRCCGKVSLTCLFIISSLLIPLQSQVQLKPHLLLLPLSPHFSEILYPHHS